MRFGCCYTPCMRYYPAFLDLHGTTCLVVGAGEVGLRKAHTLLDCGPTLLRVVDPGAPESPPSSLQNTGLTKVSWHARPFEDADLDGCFLAIAATGVPELNARIADMCKDRGILCNIVDAPECGSFIVPSVVRCGEGQEDDAVCLAPGEDAAELVAAVSTGGASPALTRSLRMRLEQELAPYSPLAVLMGRLRPLVLDMRRPTSENTALFRAVAGSPELIDAFSRRDRDAADAELARLLPESLQQHRGELLHGIV